MSGFNRMVRAFTASDPGAVDESTEAPAWRAKKPTQRDLMFAVLEQYGPGIPVSSVTLAEAAGTRSCKARGLLEKDIKDGRVGCRTKAGTGGWYWLETPMADDLKTQLQTAADLLRRHGWVVHEKPALGDSVPLSLL